MASRWACTGVLPVKYPKRNICSLWWKTEANKARVGIFHTPKEVLFSWEQFTWSKKSYCIWSQQWSRIPWRRCNNEPIHEFSCSSFHDHTIFLKCKYTVEIGRFNTAACQQKSMIAAVFPPFPPHSTPAVISSSWKVYSQPCESGSCRRVG